MDTLPSRRKLLRLGAGATAGTALAAIPMLRSAFAAEQPGPRDLMKSSLKVPRDFVGMHFHRWPEGKPLSPAPTYGYGLVRSHDYGVGWNQIHLAPGQFDWTHLDKWVETHAAHGKTLIYTLYGTPTWASSLPSLKDAYGKLGASAPPKDLGPVAEFISALVGRYNSPRRQIHFVETWNEPHFVQQGGFWMGSAAQLAALSRTVYQSAKQRDAGIKIMSPGWDGLAVGPYSIFARGVNAGPREFLQASDGAGGVGKQWFDAFAIHTYNAEVFGTSDKLQGVIQQVKETLSRFGVAVPVYVTETGFSYTSLFFPKASLPEKATMLRQQAAVHAALGMKAVCFYSHDDDYCGNPSINAPIANAIDDVQTHLAGQTLSQVTLLPSSEVKVVTGAGSFIW